MGIKVKDYYNVLYLEELAGKIGAATDKFNKEKFFELTKSSIGELEFN